MACRPEAVELGGRAELHHARHFRNCPAWIWKKGDHQSHRCNVFLKLLPRTLCIDRHSFWRVEVQMLELICDQSYTWDGVPADLNFLPLRPDIDLNQGSIALSMR
jgi:hypothetical protein